jgi:hypothetical protein
VRLPLGGPSHRRSRPPARLGRSRRSSGHPQPRPDTQNCHRHPRPAVSKCSIVRYASPRASRAHLESDEVALRTTLSACPRISRPAIHGDVLRRTLVIRSQPSDMHTVALLPERLTATGVSEKRSPPSALQAPPGRPSRVAQANPPSAGPTQPETWSAWAFTAMRLSQPYPLRRRGKPEGLWCLGGRRPQASRR